MFLLKVSCLPSATMLSSSSTRASAKIAVTNAVRPSLSWEKSSLTARGLKSYSREHYSGSTTRFTRLSLCSHLCMGRSSAPIASVITPLPVALISAALISAIQG